MNHDVSEIKEGKTSLLVPSLALTQTVPPKNPAFFNPNAKWNRDISMLVYKAYSLYSKNMTLADSICGVGARGLRASIEVPQIETIYFNDLNPVAIEYAKKSAILNKVQDKCVFRNIDVCKFLNFEEREIRRFDIVDLDPFGSPSPYIDCVLRSISNGGLISITATDTAVLCGVYPSVCYRKYYGFPIRSEYSNEIGVRLLVSFIALNAARFDLSVVPYFCHSNRHYLRTYLKIIFSSSQANNLSSKIGFIKHCQKCKSRSIEKIREQNSLCDLCGAKCIIGGPLWTDNLFDSDFLDSMFNELKNSDDYFSPGKEHDKMLKMMQICKSELPIPTYFETDGMASLAKKSSISLDKVISTLASSGFQSSKTIMNEKGFKTNASPKEIIDLLYK